MVLVKQKEEPNKIVLAKDASNILINHDESYRTKDSTKDSKRTNYTPIPPDSESKFSTAVIFIEAN